MPPHYQVDQNAVRNKDDLLLQKAFKQGRPMPKWIADSYGKNFKREWLTRRAPESEICYVKEKLQELEQVPPCKAPVTVLECQAWLASKCDGKSYTQIAFKQYPQEWNASTGKRGNNRLRMRVRRAIERVDRVLTMRREGCRPLGEGEDDPRARIYAYGMTFLPSLGSPRRDPNQLGMDGRPR